MPRMNLGLPYNHCSLASGCRVGFQSPNLLRCGACQVVKYCGKPHQKAKLRAEPGEDTGGENPFDTAVGQFWYFRSTRPYMSAYDFIKWYAVVPDEHYTWNYTSLSFLDLHDQNALEPVFEKTHYHDVSFTVALTLIKIRLMQDLDSLHAFVLRNPNVVSQEKYLDLINQLRAQILQLYKKVNEDNPHFWPGVLNPNLYAYDVPSIYTPGSREEAVLIFRQSWYSWSETQPAVQYIRGIMTNDM
ncbi:hypothetical protein FG05_03305 [Fusarium graminearum]|nr:hypothetical protein FG05_03305 [Fusarium graminearum]